MFINYLLKSSLNKENKEVNLKFKITKNILYNQTQSRYLNKYT